MPAHYGAIEEQYRDIQAIAAQKLRVGIDVHDTDRRQRDSAPEGLELGHHLIAQVAILPVHHRQSGLSRMRPRAQWRGPLTAVGPCEENELAIERTVAGGTSPTAVTFLPPMVVEYTDDEPSRADSSVTV